TSRPVTGDHHSGVWHALLRVWRHPVTRRMRRRIRSSSGGAMQSGVMKAIVVREFGGPEVLKLEEVPAPSPGQDQVLIRVRAVGVNPVDTYIRTGTYARKP